MNRKLKAALAGLAFVAGCEIGIALQLVKMIHNYTIKEAAGKESIDEAESKAVTEPAAAEPEKRKTLTQQTPWKRKPPTLLPPSLKTPTRILQRTPETHRLHLLISCCRNSLDH